MPSVSGAGTSSPCHAVVWTVLLILPSPQPLCNDRQEWVDNPNHVVRQAQGYTCSFLYQCEPRASLSHLRCFGAKCLAHVQPGSRAKPGRTLSGSKFAVMEVTYSVHEGVIGAQQGRVCHPVFSVQTCWAPVFLLICSPPQHTLYTEASLQPRHPQKGDRHGAQSYAPVQETFGFISPAVG